MIRKLSTLKLSMVLVALLLITTGCSVFKSEKDDVLFSTVIELQQQINNQEWRQALTNTGNFQNHYKNRKWKLQLLGEAEDYKEIEVKTLVLREAIKQKDELEANTTLEEILYRLQVIFEL
ncbi:MAG: DUF4363 family protein [Firmicutes bacterium]|nr:DUF4363 family protein [Bacillota bacterium]